MPVVVVGAAGVIILALLAVVIYFAAELLAKLIVNLVSRLPVVGGYLGGAARSFADTVIADTKAACVAVMQPITNLFYGIARHLVDMWDAARNFASEVSVTIERLYHTTLPQVIDRAFTKAVDWAKPYVAHAIDSVRAFIHLAVSELNTDIRRVVSRIDLAEREIANTIADVEGRITSAESQLVNDIGAAEAHAVDVARSLAGSVRADLTNAIGVVEHDAAAALAATTAAIGHRIDVAVTDLEQVAAQDALAVADSIDTAASQVAAAAWPVVTDIADGIKAATVPVEDIIKGAVDAIPQAVPTTLEGTLAATMAVATVGADFANECGLDLCSNLNGLGNFLANLGADLADGVLFGLVALLITDPQAGVDLTRVTLGPIVSGASAMVTEVIDIGRSVA